MINAYSPISGVAGPSYANGIMATTKKQQNQNSKKKRLKSGKMCKPRHYGVESAMSLIMLDNVFPVQL